MLRLLLIFLPLLGFTYSAFSETGDERYDRLFLGASASFTSLNNWGNNDITTFSTLASLDYRSSVDYVGSSVFKSLQFELGMIKYADSTWTKSSDLIRLNCQYRQQKRSVMVNYSIMLQTQLLNSYSYEFSESEFKKVQTGGLFLPFQLEIGYGLAWRFWTYSTVSISMATVKLSLYPEIDARRIIAIGDEVAKTRRGVLFMEYGFSGSWYINKSLNERLEWKSNGNFFGNGLSRSKFQLSVSNQLSFTIWKYLKLILDSRLNYYPAYSYKMQFRNEILLGWYFDSSLLKNKK